MVGTCNHGTRSRQQRGHTSAAWLTRQSRTGSEMAYAMSRLISSDLISPWVVSTPTRATERGRVVKTRMSREDRVGVGDEVASRR